MRSLLKFLKKDKEMQEMDEPSPPNAERAGLWRILAASTLAAIVTLVLIAVVMA